MALRCAFVAIRFVEFRETLVGNQVIMDRKELLARMLDAATPNHTSTVVYEGRRWLLDHPNDQAVRYVMADLMGLERQSLSRV